MDFTVMFQYIHVRKQSKVKSAGLTISSMEDELVVGHGPADVIAGLNLHLILGVGM